MGIILDIETAGFELEDLAESQQEFLLRYAEKERDERLKEEKNRDFIWVINNCNINFLL